MIAQGLQPLFTYMSQTSNKICDVCKALAQATTQVRKARCRSLAGDRISEAPAPHTSASESEICSLEDTCRWKPT